MATADRPASSSATPRRRGGGFEIGDVHVAAAARGITHPAVLAVFDPERDRKLQIPYAEQGDPSMYTEAALKERERLRVNPGIVDALKRLSRLLPFDPDTGISRDVYLRFHDSVVDTLLPGASEEQRAAIQARDWSADSGGKDTLPYDRFARAMFELADQWTTSVNADEYVAFINALRFKLSRPPSKK